MGVPQFLAFEMVRVIPSLSRRILPNNIVIHPLYKCHTQVTNSIRRMNFIKHCRFYATEDKNKRSLTETNSRNVTPSTFEQVKENTKTASYLGVIVVGLGVTGIMFYTVFRELFSSRSPNSVYAAALKRCCTEPRVSDALGEPIKGYGEETRRGRRRHVSHIFYQKDGINYLRMKFYIQGSRRKGTVHLEMREGDTGYFEYKYLIVQLDDYPKETIIVEDNRYDATIDVAETFDV